MTQKINSSFVGRTMVLTAILFFMVAAHWSCTKPGDSTPANQKFIGTFNGNDCNGNPATVMIISGGNNNTVFLPSNLGAGSCNTGFNLVGTVSGNNLTFSSQVFTDACGTVTVTISGAGSISGNTISMNLTNVEVASGSTQTVSNCFTGTK